MFPKPIDVFCAWFAAKRKQTARLLNSRVHTSHLPSLWPRRPTSGPPSARRDVFKLGRVRRPGCCHKRKQRALPPPNSTVCKSHTEPFGRDCMQKCFPLRRKTNPTVFIFLVAHIPPESLLCKPPIGEWACARRSRTQPPVALCRRRTLWLRGEESQGREGGTKKNGSLEHRCENGLAEASTPPAIFSIEVLNNTKAAHHEPST
jgi:hypothetical protein